MGMPVSGEEGPSLKDSGDAAERTLFRMLDPAQPTTAPEVAITSCPSRWSPAWPRRRGIYAPLCQAALMDCFQDGSRVSGIHLPDVLSFSFKSLLSPAAVRAWSWAALPVGLPMGKHL